MPFYERQPYISPLYQILAEVLRGEILIPRFQRPGTEWNSTQRGDLLDSLYRGFPIGTILLWSTNSPIKTKENVGGFKVPLDSLRGERRLLLDGHQRLSSLVQILGPGLVRDLQLTSVEPVAEEADTAGAREAWVFELDPPKSETPTRSRDRFVLLKPGQKPTPTQLPLELALSRIELNRWVRRETERKLSDAQVTQVDSLRDRLREYNVPVAVLAVDSLDDATESFKRINSSGTPMTDFNMVAALAYREGQDPQELFERFRSELLEPLGWKDLSDMDVLRVCAALAQQHPAKLEVDKLAERLVTQKDLIKRAFQAMADGARLMGQLCGITGPEVLPYSWQLITLAVWLGAASRYPSEKPAFEAIRRWLWLTTYGEVFAGVNSAIYDRSLKALREMIEGGSSQAMDRDLTRKVRPVSTFDFRAARAKAVALAMARYADGGDLSGGAAHCALAAGAEAIGVLQASGRRSDWWNRVIISSGSISDYRTALKNRAARSSQPDEAQADATQLDEDRLLEKIGIARDAEGTIPDLLTARRQRIEAEERQFIGKLGLDWAT